MPLEFRPKLDKIVELLLYLAHKKPGADKYQVVKFFYLADREHLNRYGRPITYETYYALKYGPVASKAKGLMDGDRWTMREAGLRDLPFDTVKEKRRGPDKSDLILLGKPHREVDFSVFSRSDLAVFDEVLEKYGNLNFDQLYNLTHEHEAYKKAWGKRGLFQRGLMDYGDMIESKEARERMLADIGPVSAHI